MNFIDYFNIAVDAITAAAGIISIAQAFQNHQKEREEIGASEWKNFCKMFKKYVNEHRELNIEVVEPKKRGMATKYQKKSS